MATPQKETTAAREQVAATPRSRELTEDGEVVILRDNKLSYDITTTNTGKTVIIGARGDIRILAHGPQNGPLPQRQEIRENGEVIIHRTQARAYVLKPEEPAPGHGTSVSGLSGDRITVKPDGGITVGNK